MKKKQKIFGFLMLAILMPPIMIYSQDTFTKFRLSGFDVKLIQSDKYAIEVDETFEVKKEVINGVLSIQVLDQTGPIPKSTVTIYANQINYLELHNCKITTETLISTTSLTVELSSSFGSLNSNSKSLAISAGGGSTFNIEGHTDYLICNIGGASNVSASKFFAEQAEVDIMGYSSLVGNIKNIINHVCENSTFRNIYKP